MTSRTTTNSHAYREYTLYSKLNINYCSIGYTNVKNEQQKCVDWNYVICLTSGTSTAAGCSQANGSASLVFVKRQALLFILLGDI